MNSYIPETYRIARSRRVHPCLTGLTSLSDEDSQNRSPLGAGFTHGDFRGELKKEMIGDVTFSRAKTNSPRSGGSPKFLLLRTPPPLESRSLAGLSEIPATMRTG